MCLVSSLILTAWCFQMNQCELGNVSIQQQGYSASIDIIRVAPAFGSSICVVLNSDDGDDGKLQRSIHPYEHSLP